MKALIAETCEETLDSLEPNFIRNEDSAAWYDFSVSDLKEKRIRTDAGIQIKSSVFQHDA
jgi:hypothetical protein